MSFFNPAWHLVKGKDFYFFRSYEKVKKRNRYKFNLRQILLRHIQTSIMSKNLNKCLFILAKNTDKKRAEIWNKTKKHSFSEKRVDENNNEIEQILNTENTDQHQQILWLNVFFISLFHLIAALAFLRYTPIAKFWTIFWGK